jgi:GNAT superfamily N-acetyltransferase
VTDSELDARCCETIAGFLALGNERFEAHGATFIRNRDTPRRHDTNTLALIRTEGTDEIEALLRRFEVEFEGFKHRRFEIDPLTPPQFEARLAFEGGYKRSELLTLVLEGELSTRPVDADVREVVTEGEWAAYRRLDELWWRESSAAYFGPYDPELHDELSRSWRLKTPAMRSWLAWMDGEARAFLSSYPGENGVGQVEDLFTEPDYRHRGLATALISRAVADARERGAVPVLIIADPDETPRQMYAALGFRPLFLYRDFTKLLPGHYSEASL